MLPQQDIVDAGGDTVGSSQDLSVTDESAATEWGAVVLSSDQPHLPGVLIGLSGHPAHNLGDGVGLATLAVGQRWGCGGGRRRGRRGEETARAGLEQEGDQEIGSSFHGVLNRLATELSLKNIRKI